MAPEKPSFREACWFWLKLGFISFGGPAGQIAIMHEFLVEKKKWISESRFLHALNYTMILPGPEAQQLATYIGWLLHGTKGGLVAGSLFVLPSMFILLGLSILYVKLGHIAWVYAMFYGLKPAVVAIVILALIKIGKKSLHSAFHLLLAGAAFVCLFFFNISFPLIILGSLVVAVIAQRLLPSLFPIPTTSNSSLDPEEANYVINRYQTHPDAGFRGLRLARQIAVILLLWAVPLVLFYLFVRDYAFWQQLSVFFSQAALVTFGGAYAVLPYVAQVSVEQLRWLSKLQMVDGLALGETTPGPLIMVLVFVGFMAGYNHFGGSVLMGTLALVTTTFYTFLFCFFFIFAGTPMIEKTQESPRIKQMLGLVTAAVVGVILNLTLYLGQAVIFPKGLSFAGMDIAALVWVILSFVAMFRFNIGMIPWIGISALFGLFHHVVL